MFFFLARIVLIFDRRILEASAHGSHPPPMALCNKSAPLRYGDRRAPTSTLDDFCEKLYLPIAVLVGVSRIGLQGRYFYQLIVATKNSRAIRRDRSWFRISFVIHRDLPIKQARKKDRLIHSDPSSGTTQRDVIRRKTIVRSTALYSFR